MACQSTHSVKSPDGKELKIVTHPDIIKRVNDKTERLERNLKLSSFSTSSSTFLLTQPFLDLCIITGYDSFDHERDYIEKFLETDGNPIICSQKLASYVVDNKEKANLIHIKWMNDLKRKLDIYTHILEKENSKSMRNILNKYGRYYKEVKLLSETLDEAKELDRLANNPRIWILESAFDEFEQEKIESVHLKGHYGIAIQCRTKSDKSVLSLKWDAGKIIATPNSEVTFITILNNKPIKLKSSTYSNSYQAGYISDNNNLNFDKVLESLISGKEFRYRLQSLRRSTVIDNTIPKADGTGNIKALLANCSHPKGN